MEAPCQARFGTLIGGADRQLQVLVLVTWPGILDWL